MTPDKSDVLYGTLGLMVIKTLEALGPMQGTALPGGIEHIRRGSGSIRASLPAAQLEQWDGFVRWGDPRAADG